MTFVGFSAQPLAWMQVMDVFLFASNREGLTRVLIEAMLCKKALVAARAVGPSEIILHQETGYLYDYGDVSSLASYISALARDKKMRLRMGELGFVRAKNIFNMNAYISGVEKILLESLK
jgi:glycosyltransferase involved in cell wall biosynthesis